MSVSTAGGCGAFTSWDVKTSGGRDKYNALDANPSGTLANALGTGTNQIQPGQAFTQAAAGSTFGLLRSTVGTTVGLGTNRQIQFAARVSF